MREKKSKKATPVGAELEQAAREYANKVWLNFYKEYEKFSMSNKECGKLLPKDLLIWEAIRKAYEKGAEWQKQRLINKACRWVENIHDGTYLRNDDCGYTDIHWTEFIKDFRKAMEE